MELTGEALEAHVEALVRAAVAQVLSMPGTAVLPPEKPLNLFQRGYRTFPTRCFLKEFVGKTAV